MTNDEKIQAIVATIDDWDLKTCVDYAKDRMEEALRQYCDTELDEEYRIACLGE